MKLKFSGLLFLCAALLMLDVAPAMSQAIPFGARFRIVNDRTGMCWDAAGPIQESTYVQQFPCHLGPNQTWFLEQKPKGMHIILEGTRLCASLKPDSGVTRIDLRPCPVGRVDSDPFQTWNLRRADAGSRHVEGLFNIKGNACADVPSGILTPTLLKLFRCHGGLNQQWVIMMAE